MCAELADLAMQLARAAALLADPRRTPVREAFTNAIKNHPGRAELIREINTRLDNEITADPDQTIDPLDLFLTISQQVGIEIDYATIPDEILFAPGEIPGAGKITATHYLTPRATPPP